MIISFDGIYYDYNKSNAIKLNYKMYDDFCKCCKQEHYSYELISETPEYVICHADNHAIEFFIGCMKSEHEEIIKMLCSLSKSTLADRLDGLHFEEESEKWIDNVDINLVKEALYRYDEHEFVEERAKMMKTYDLNEKILIEENIVHPFFDEIMETEIINAKESIKYDDIDLYNKSNVFISDLLRINHRLLKTCDRTYFINYIKEQDFYYHTIKDVISLDIKIYTLKNNNVLSNKGLELAFELHRNYDLLSKRLYHNEKRNIKSLYADFLHMVFLNLYRYNKNYLSV